MFILLFCFLSLFFDAGLSRFSRFSNPRPLLSAAPISRGGHRPPPHTEENDGKGCRESRGEWSRGVMEWWSAGAMRQEVTEENGVKKSPCRDFVPGLVAAIVLALLPIPIRSPILKTWRQFGRFRGRALAFFGPRLTRTPANPVVHAANGFYL